MKKKLPEMVKWVLQIVSLVEELYRISFFHQDIATENAIQFEFNLNL